MMITLRHTKPDLNMDRYYSVQLTLGLFGDFGLERHWGRVGTWGQTRLNWFGTECEAEAALSRLVHQKLAKGYVLKSSVSLIFLH